ncbi:hypothetical protein V5279_40940 [Bradyrhizobium sp. 26S5]|uniref:hypothetical protein n=1 Tax=Bradyrhizobium sp. 26S5 TaxID=3139729 RepID=UPI0030D2A73C
MSYIDERPFTNFVIDSLAYELRHEEYVSGEWTEKTLTTIERFKDVRALASRLVDAFDGLPRKYMLSLRLPKELDTIIGPKTDVINLSSDIRIVRATSQFRKTFPLENTIGDLGEKLVGGAALASVSHVIEQAEWEDDALYLQISVSGFIGMYGRSNTLQDGQRALRSVFGLGLALELLETRVQPTLASPRASLVVHQERPDSSWEVFERFYLNDSVAATLNTLRLGTVNDSINTPKRRNIRSERIFEQMRGIFRQQEKAEFLLLAAQWYFDGSHGADELLRYVQSMIVIEIILGDKATSDQMGLSELLRNRCAYLIGNSQEQREEILDEFRRIYDVRSQIVHRGKHRLTTDERWLLSYLRWICSRVIEREVELLNANKKPEDPIAMS